VEEDTLMEDMDIEASFVEDTYLFLVELYFDLDI
jgi:hypothetical protein